MTTVIITLIVVAIIALVAFFMFSRRTGMKSGSSPIESAAQSIAPEKPAPVQELKEVMDSLLSLNIMIRKDPGLAVDLLEKLETIIDDLRVAIPQMMERYPSETLTYEIKKIGSQHLYKTVKEFMDLSLESRNNQLDIFTKTIDNLHEVSERARAIVEKNETAEFKTMANFLSTKFS